MVVWFSLETDQEYSFDQLKSFLYKLVDFHVEELNYHLANAGNQLLVDTDGLRQELAFKTELLKEEFDLAKNSNRKRTDLTHVLTISSLDPDNENTYMYTDDPKNAKQKTATRNFTRLLKMYPEFSQFQLKHNYER